MSDLIVVAFEDEASGFELRAELVKMQQEYLLELEDVVVATRSSENDIKLHQAVNLTAAGALGGGFWGTLVGLLFLNPLLGAAVGAASGAIAGRFSDIGINDDFMRDVSKAIVPGGSAVFILLRKMTADKVLARLESFHKKGRILQSSLSDADEAKLREAFAGGTLAQTVNPATSSTAGAATTAQTPEPSQS
ncbi:DUF1269 domain-containing protein [Paracoccus aminophilus]|uniref:Membrane protein of uknown function UCP014873 n=1 Tax=Paracoccus aminophilus JCM 7686 TaxID=1367847 RepID=S5XXQ3_PARAH|nr:DUF1269 domain-containing protein [Paracoccus aminophilus]AGT10057.1 hypothetical protein JCM7686_3021 [Paracoccus aminophilus JCM 7686]